MRTRVQSSRFGVQADTTQRMGTHSSMKREVCVCDVGVGDMADFSL